MPAATVRRTAYPFSAIVGQDALRRALLVLAVNPRVGGLLVRGEKGTAKSTAVRSLTALLPHIRVVAGCRFQCDPDAPAAHLCAACRARRERGETLPAEQRPMRAVDLPVGATLDRVVGAVDFQAAVRTGARAIEPGVLAEAHRGFLYVDEINLLDDALANALLDAHASGINRLEREGVSAQHATAFALVGTMNPEEGELRPQLLDRFGLCVDVQQLESVEERLAVLRRRELFDADAAAFSAAYLEADARLAERLAAARELLPLVNLSDHMGQAIAAICLYNGVAGHRADLAMTATARALAALDDRTEVAFADLREAAHLALRHRARPDRRDERALQTLETLVTQGPADRFTLRGDTEGDGAEHAVAQLGNGDAGGHQEADGAGNTSGTPTGDAGGSAPRPAASDGGTGSDAVGAARLAADGAPVDLDGEGVVFEVGELFRVPPLLTGRIRSYRTRAGRRAAARTSLRRGRYVRSTLDRGGQDLALDATIRAAAPHQHRRTSPLAIAIEPPDVREKMREQQSGYLLVFVVDASGSMGTTLMSATKAAMISLLLDAYQRRDRVALVTFAGTRAEVLLPPTNSVDVAQRLLAALPAGGKTPLAHALVRGYELIGEHLRRWPDVEPWLILISDGEANVGLHGDTRYDGTGYRLLVDEVLRTAAAIQRDGRVHALVIDTESHRFAMFRDSRSRRSMAHRIAHALGGAYARLEAFQSGEILHHVRAHLA